ncbi:class II fructose-1,6-bisphosphate aldolase [Candidatus Woesearchaeota archaeon]|nr:class II fructose-1,6-bisphosphate aldolase [Candidatus Woesearchaeota archaeon]
MLVTGKEILVKAREGRYGVGAFNFVNMEILQVLLQAANEERSPIIIQATEGAVKYVGLPFLKGFASIINEVAQVPAALHLDHGQSLDTVKKVIDAGFTSVMIDASHHDYEENIRITKEVVEYAHSKGVTVEAELGTIGGEEDGVEAKHIIYTEPETAKDFVERTGVDYLAIAIGTSHGAYKFQGEAKLNFEILDKIKEMIPIPLVLHGASSIPHDAVQRINDNGGNVQDAHGVDDVTMSEAVSRGISKVNTDSDLRLIWTGSVREVLMKKPEVFDLRKIISPARENLVNYIKHRMQVMGSSGKA